MKLVQSLCGLVLVGAVVLAGCDSKPTHDSVMKDSIASMNEMTDILKGVKDEDTAKDAAPKMKKVSEKMEALKKSADTLGKPTADQETELKKKYDADMKKAVDGFFAEAMRVGMNPKLAPLLKDSMPKSPGM